MTRTLADVPDTVTFVDEAGELMPEYGELKLDLFVRSIVLAKARASKQSIDTTLERMITAALRRFIKQAVQGG